MITKGAPFSKKLSVLLGVVFCCMLLVAKPFGLYAAGIHASPSPAAAESSYMGESADLPFAVETGEVSSGDPEAVLQLDQILLAQSVHSLLRPRYPVGSGSPAVPAFYAFPKSNCGLHSILTKGP